MIFALYDNVTVHAAILNAQLKHLKASEPVGGNGLLSTFKPKSSQGNEGSKDLCTHSVGTAFSGSHQGVGDDALLYARQDLPGQCKLHIADTLTSAFRQKCGE
jgi:hypothetical protein